MTKQETLNFLHGMMSEIPEPRKPLYYSQYLFTLDMINSVSDSATLPETSPNTGSNTAEVNPDNPQIVP